jgi:hypothetical protein
MRGEESSYIVIVNGERARQAPSQQIIIFASTGPSPKNGLFLVLHKENFLQVSTIFLNPQRSSFFDAASMQRIFYLE